MQSWRRFLFGIVALTVFHWLLPDAMAQCAMCKTAAASQQAEAIRSLNIGILILLVPSLLCFAGIFAVALRLKHRQQQDE